MRDRESLTGLYLRIVECRRWVVEELWEDATMNIYYRCCG